MRENVELSVFPRGLLQIDSSWPRMLKCSVVFTQSALTGLVSEHNAAVFMGSYQCAVRRLLTDRKNKGQNEAGSDVRDAQNRSSTFINAV